MAKVHYTLDVPRGRQRFRELIVYISEKSADDPSFGATKLNKIFYHSDFRAFERFGSPLTGFSYFRLEWGPAPRALIPIRLELILEHAICLVEGPEGQDRTVALRKPFLDHFTGDEIGIVDEVISELWGKSAKSVSDESHGVAWKTRGDRQTIPYEAAFLSDEVPTNFDIQDARRLNKEHGWGLDL